MMLVKVQVGQDRNCSKLSPESVPLVLSVRKWFKVLPTKGSVCGTGQKVGQETGQTPVRFDYAADTGQGIGVDLACYWFYS